ncbi:hypothetical protein RJD24_14850 [Bacillaceae bacterium IKA-2]|nr:hypothetical protein RJD24_14850 [Bacillaceae bacterium IKA-2]
MGLLQGCSPGFWAQHPQQWNLTPYSPDDIFNTVFGVVVFSADATLLQVINLDAEGPSPQVRQLSRQAVAALLNASDPRVNYPLTEAEVIAQYQNAINSGDLAVIVALSELFDSFNNLGCPIPAN